MRLDTDKPYSGKIMVLSGNVGNGKGVFAVAYTRWASKRCFHGTLLSEDCFYCVKYGYSDKERKLIVYPNFPMKIPDIDIRFMSNYRDFIDIPNWHKLKNHKLAILDEPNAWGFDSYDAKSIPAKQIARKIQQTRHYNMDTLFLSQLWSMIAPRGKRLSANIMATYPSNSEFQYGMYKLDELIPISIKKKFARDKIFPFYDSSFIVGEENFTELEGENSESGLVIN